MNSTARTVTGVAAPTLRLVAAACVALSSLCHCGGDSTVVDPGTTSSSSAVVGGGGVGGGSASGGLAAGGGSAGSAGGESSCDALPETFAAGHSPSAIIHVDGDAQAGGDGSENQPFASLAAAQAAVMPGTEIVIHNEVVNNSALSFTGTAEAPIWITGAPGAKLRGGSASALRLVNTSYLIVQDLELFESPNHVLHFDHSDHLMFRRLHVHRAAEACLKGSQTTHLYVEDCDFHGAGELPGGDPVSVQVLDLVGVNTGYIVRSKFHDGHHVMVMLKGGTSDLLFAFNEIYDQTNTEESALGLGQWTGSPYFQPLDADFEAVNLVAFANFIHDVSGPFFSFLGAKNCAAIHNTMHKSDGGQLVRFLPGNTGEDSAETESKPEDCRFSGNVVVGGRADGASLNAGAAYLGLGNALDNNVWLKPGPLNWWSDLDQEPAPASTYDQDPLIAADGTPENSALVQQLGTTDLGGTPFAEYFTRDFRGTCISLPMDRGAIEIR